MLIVLAETLHHIPGLEALNAFGSAHAPLQLGLLVGLPALRSGHCCDSAVGQGYNAVTLAIKAPV